MILFVFLILLAINFFGAHDPLSNSNFKKDILEFIVLPSNTSAPVFDANGTAVNQTLEAISHPVYTHEALDFLDDCTETLKIWFLFYLGIIFVKYIFSMHRFCVVLKTYPEDGRR